MEQQYTNYAFISYKREDEKWAKWLQRKLENYKLPSVIRKESANLPKYIRPIFRDGTDLTGGVLIKRLHEELMHSQYLIVICSPNVAKSDWVNKEVQAFIDAGRQEQIIPFIISGTPHAQDVSEECFPEALLDIPEEKELLGINIQELGRNMAFVRLVATLLNVRFDTLWQRHRRNQIRHHIIIGVVATLAVLVGLFVWDYNRVIYSYYADYVDRWGVPEGVVLLTKDQVSRRYRSCQFEYRRIPFGEPNAYSWRLTRVMYVNSTLIPHEMAGSVETELHDRFPIQEIEYNKNTGIVSRINYYNAHGKLLLRHVLSERDGVPAAIADFIDPHEEKGTAFIGEDLTSMAQGPMDADQNKSNITRYAYERNKSGYIIRKTYHSNNDYQLSRSATCDIDSIFGCSYTLDSFGRCAKLTYLGIDGAKTQTMYGIAEKLYEYDKHGTISKVTYKSIDGKPILNVQLWAIAINKTDENGNIIETKYYDVAGKPCSTILKYAKITLKYDEQGNRIEKAYYDAEGKSCIMIQGCAKITQKFDKQGNCVEEAMYDTEGRSCNDLFGCAKVTFKYNDRGYLIERIYYNVERKQVIKNTFCYDNQGNLVEK